LRGGALNNRRRAGLAPARQLEAGMGANTETRFLIVGGAGFIGSHFCEVLMRRRGTAGVTVYDNFTSGRNWHVEPHLADPRFKVVRGDVHEMEKLTEALRGHDVVIHLASNPDIAKAMTEPDIDFREGTHLTNNVIEAMRRAGVPRILYASGSGVYGEAAHIEFQEDHTPMQPISTYGASKLAGEVLICAYAHMFGMSGLCFRFGNVVGPRQTHGVGFDFVKQLHKTPGRLKLLGDGTQTKSYIAVEDVIAAVLHAHETVQEKFQVFNVATGDYISVREIGELAAEIVTGDAKSVAFEYTGGDRGWKGDVPIVRLNTDRINATGWRCQRPTREAMRWSMTAMLGEVKKGLL
jgi:UDP-glucose 4-epimerase